MTGKYTGRNSFRNFIFLILILFLAVSCENNNGIKEYTKLIKTAKAIQISTEKQEQFSGVIEEVDQMNLSFRVAGPIKKIFVKEGDYVKTGQLIAEMDTRDYRVQKNAIEARVIQLQSEYKRIEELKSRGSVADNDYEKMKAGKDMAEAKLKNAIDQLNDTKLKAPFSGYITKVMFEEGELVNQGTPIASLIDISTLKVEINVPADLYINKDKITNIICTQEDIPGVDFSLELRGDNKKANNNGLYKFYLYYTPSKHTKLSPGMNVSVSITHTAKDSLMLTVPLNSVFERKGESFVWLVQDSIVKLRKIETNSLVKDGDITVVSGLKPGDEVVSAGLSHLKEDEKVRIVASGSKTNVGNLL